MIARFETYGLSAGERPKVLYAYYVTGSGSFPLDMLRYDKCWPVSGYDAVDIVNVARSRSILMNSYKEPTIDRWSSFLWSVGTEKLK